MGGVISKPTINMTGRTDTTDLPALLNVVLPIICQHLDKNDLMNARLSCKKLKSFVETAAVLENFPIKVSFHHHLRRLIKCDVPFNNLVLKYHDRNDAEQLDLSKLGQKGGGYIRKLQINNCIKEEYVIQLLSACSELKEVEIMTVNRVLYQEDSSTFERVLKSFAALNKLIIHEIKGRYYDAADAQEDVNFFFKILRNCNQLKCITVPRIPSYLSVLEMRMRFNRERKERENMNNNDNERNENFEEDFEENWEEETKLIDKMPNWGRNDFGNENVDDIFVRSMIDFIRSKINKRDEKNFPVVKQIDITNLPCIEVNVFKDLLDFSYDNEISLVGVGKHVPWSMRFNERELTFNPKHGDVIKSAEDIVCLPYVFPLVGFQNLTSLSMTIHAFWYTDKTHLTEKTDLSLPHLQNLRINLLGDESGEQSERLINKLLKDYQRPTVKKLAIKWQEEQLRETVSGIELANNFNNLKELEVDRWNALDSEFCLLWTNLLKLEKVSILNCGNLTNKGFVGNFDLTHFGNIDQRPFNRLKKLKSLIIQDRAGRINEVAILGSFRWMKLQYFDFCSYSEISKDAYMALAHAPFGNYVHYCFLPMPQSTSHEKSHFDKYEFSKEFGNLKRPVNWTRWNFRYPYEF